MPKNLKGGCSWEIISSQPNENPMNASGYITSRSHASNLKDLLNQKNTSHL